MLITWLYESYRGGLPESPFCHTPSPTLQKVCVLVFIAFLPTLWVDSLLAGWWVRSSEPVCGRGLESAMPVWCVNFLVQKIIQGEAWSRELLMSQSTTQNSERWLCRAGAFRIHHTPGNPVDQDTEKGQQLREHVT